VSKDDCLLNLGFSVNILLEIALNDHFPGFVVSAEFQEELFGLDAVEHACCGQAFCTHGVGSRINDVLIAEHLALADLKKSDNLVPLEFAFYRFASLLQDGAILQSHRRLWTNQPPCRLVIQRRRIFSLLLSNS
jgi:hypothetical protein